MTSPPAGPWNRRLLDAVLQLRFLNVYVKDESKALSFALCSASPVLGSLVPWKWDKRFPTNQTFGRRFSNHFCKGKRS